MKRLLFRFAALSLLVMATFYVAKTSEACTDCGGSWFAAQYGCDDAYIGKINNFNSLANSPTSHSCYTNAVAACTNDPDPATCIYNQYASCHNDVVTAYNDRYNTYSTCLNGAILGAEAQPCTHSPDYCPEAYGRRDQCVNTYLSVPNPTFEDYSSYQACIEAIPNRQNCPGIQL